MLPVMAITTAAGVATSTFSSMTYGTYVAQVRQDDTNGAVLAITIITFTILPCSVTNSTIVANPTSTLADGASTISVSTALIDALSRGVPNQTVQLTYNLSSGGTPTIMPATTPTDGNGVAVFSMNASATTTGTLTATINPGSPGSQVLAAHPTVSFRLPVSCKELHASNSSTSDGVYSIDANDGNGAFQVWCDMTNDGGGWTLALRVQSSTSVFRDFFNPLWTTSTPLNEAANINPTYDGDAKFASYAQLAGSEIRGCLKNTSSGLYGCKFYTYSTSTPQTLLSLFSTTPVGSDSSGKGLYFTEATPQSWLTMWGLSYANNTAGNPPGYAKVGLNIDDDQSCYQARVRFGLAMNNETTIYTLNDTAGFGASAYCASDCSPVESCWRVGAGLQAGATTYATQGTIWVR
jgi:hypothetical protein